tara:strand:+ start:427 stop:837 length:411 start_codon:yes stop_codon:yes gene_type:complete
MDITNIISKALSKPTDSEIEDRIDEMVIYPKDIDPSLYEHGLVIRRVSMLTGKTREKFVEGLTLNMLRQWMAGESSQIAFTGINAEYREFIQTGITAAEWGTAFPEFHDDDEWNDHQESQKIADTFNTVFYNEGGE